MSKTLKKGEISLILESFKKTCQDNPDRVPTYLSLENAASAAAMVWSIS